MGRAEDAALVERARGGDARALEDLLEQHQDQIYRFTRRMCRDPEDARDVLQDTMLAAARNIAGFRGGSSLSTWLFTIARSYCIKRHRKERGERAELEPDTLLDPGRAPDDALAGKQLERAVEAAILALEPKYREVLMLRDVEGLSAAETSEVLGLGVPAVKSRLHRARLMVREAVAPALGIAPLAASPGCPDVLEVFSRHIEGDVRAEDCAAMEAHLEGCPRCRGACDSLRETLALCKTAAPRVEVPGPVKQAVQSALRGFLGGR